MFSKERQGKKAPFFFKNKHLNRTEQTEEIMVSHKVMESIRAEQRSQEWKNLSAGTSKNVVAAASASNQQQLVASTSSSSSSTPKSIPNVHAKLDAIRQQQRMMEFRSYQKNWTHTLAFYQ